MGRFHLPDGGVGQTLRVCRKVIARNQPGSPESTVAETLVRILVGENVGALFIAGTYRKRYDPYVPPADAKPMVVE